MAVDDYYDDSSPQAPSRSADDANAADDAHGKGDDESSEEATTTIPKSICPDAKPGTKITFEVDKITENELVVHYLDHENEGEEESSHEGDMAKGDQPGAGEGQGDEEMRGMYS